MSKPTEGDWNKVLAWAFPISLSLEILIYALSLIVPLILISYAVQLDSLYIGAAIVLCSAILFAFSIALFSVLFIRLLPKPATGQSTDPLQLLKHHILVSLTMYLMRTPGGRFYHVFPFPGYLFHWISGAKFGKGTVSGDRVIIFDDYLVEIGNNCTLGGGCIISGHFGTKEGEQLIGKVKIGNNVSIGDGSTIWPNVTIGDNVKILEKSAVMPGTIILSNQVWGGVPAKKISGK